MILTPAPEKQNAWLDSHQEQRMDYLQSPSNPYCLQGKGPGWDRATWGGRWMLTCLEATKACCSIFWGQATWENEGLRGSVTKQQGSGYCYLYIVEKWHVISPIFGIVTFLIQSIYIWKLPANHSRACFVASCHLCMLGTLELIGILFMLNTIYPYFGCNHQGKLTPFPHCFSRIKASPGFLLGLHWVFESPWLLYSHWVTICDTRQYHCTRVPFTMFKP